MKTHSGKARQDAMALVIVLGALVLVALLGIGFFASTTRELSASKSYASGVSARFYADAAVNVVLGQMRAATTEDDATKTWTSQPGLLRQFNNQGDQTRVFKLYSSDKMIEGGSFSLLAGGNPSDVPAWTSSTAVSDLPWNRDPGVYTDLNAPITVNSRTNYPIINPGGLHAATRIQGFDVSAGYALLDPADPAKIAQIPMPVRWLYLLKDGSLATATRTGDKTISLALANGGAVPDSNPPVARIAFWADDDTCRLNINTASEGDYWTLPVAVGANKDDSLSSGQVNAREFQRYPGHPATTSLSPVLGFLTTDTTDLRNFIFGIAPRISGRGSQFGSIPITKSTQYLVNLDSDRLYASVDDLLFLPKFDSAAGERYRTSTDNLIKIKVNELDLKAGNSYSFSNSSSLDPARLELLRFFLTVDSNAPEVNLFGKPRVSLWPVDTRVAYQSLQDKLLAFCATVNGSKYYFQRQNPDSRTEDYDSISRNQELLSYLDNLTSTPIPGLGGNLSSKYGSADRSQMLTSIFDWIRTVNLAYRDPAGSVQSYAWQANPAADGTTRPPGLPGSGQVLPIKIGATSGFGRFPTLSKGAIAIVREEELPNTPTTGKTTVKYRVVFLMETYVPMLGYAGFVPNYQIAVSGLSGFQAVTDMTATAASNTSVAGSVQTFPLTFQEGAIQANVPANVEPFTGRAWGGTQGYNNLFLYNDTSSGLKARTLGSTDSSTGYPFSAEFSVVINDDANDTDPADTDKAKDRIRVGLNLAGTVNVTFKDAQGSQTLGSYSLPFAPFGPVKGASLGDVNAGMGELDNPVRPNSNASNGNLKPKLQDRIDQMARAWTIYYGVGSGETSSFNRTWITSKNALGLNDVVRGLELGHGDLRLLALHGSGGTNVFVKHKSYAGTSPHAHSLLGSGGNALAFYDSTSNNLVNSRGFLVAGTSSGFNGGTQVQYLPQAPSSMPSLTPSYAGDFTTSIGSEGDGPHILKADEGNSSFVGFGRGMSDGYPYQNQLFPWDSQLSDVFSPNRQVSSAVQLGTLPAMAASDTPWRTLLFRPNILATPHPGAASPADSALLDLFWMPVVDPYPISQPLSTAGKVNMNSQIAPFTYVERSSALLGALKSVKVMAIPVQNNMFYKMSGYVPDSSKSRWDMSYLYEVDATKTLLFFKERFSSTTPSDNVFKSPSEICAIPLAPKQNRYSVVSTGHSAPDPVADHPISTANIGGATDAASLRTAIKDFWAKNTLTGDNVLEAPYNHLYPRLTTQSNTYTVYVQAQSLQVAANSSLSNLPESRIRVNGEYRAAFGVERYIDQADTTIPDFASSANFSKTLYPYYKFRIKGSRQFLPQ